VTWLLMIRPPGDEDRRVHRVAEFTGMTHECPDHRNAERASVTMPAAWAQVAATDSRGGEAVPRISSRTVAKRPVTS